MAGKRNLIIFVLTIITVLFIIFVTSDIINYDFYGLNIFEYNNFSSNSSNNNDKLFCNNAAFKMTNNDGKWISLYNNDSLKMKSLGWGYNVSKIGNYIRKNYHCEGKGKDKLINKYVNRLWLPIDCSIYDYSTLLPPNITILFIGNSHINQIYSSIVARALQLNIVKEYYTLNVDKKKHMTCICGYDFNKDYCLGNDALGIRNVGISSFTMNNNARILSLINHPIQTQKVDGILQLNNYHKNFDIKKADIVLINQGNGYFWFNRVWQSNESQPYYYHCKNLDKYNMSPYDNRTPYHFISNNSNDLYQLFGLNPSNTLILKMPSGYNKTYLNKSVYNFNTLNILTNKNDTLFTDFDPKWGDHRHQCLPGVPDSFAQILIWEAFQKYNNKINA